MGPYTTKKSRIEPVLPDDPLQKKWAEAYPREVKAFMKTIYNSLDDGHKLPEHQREFLAGLKDLSAYEKIVLINAQINDSIKWSSQDHDGCDIPLTYPGAVSQSKGDCDNFATAKFGMLLESGIPKNNVVFVAGEATYSTHINGRTQTQNPVGHAFCIVKIDDELYMLDNNMEDPVLLRRNDEGYWEGDGRIILKTGEEVKLDVKINKIYFLADGDPRTKPIIMDTPPLPEAVRKLYEKNASLDTAQSLAEPAYTGAPALT